MTDAAKARLLRRELHSPRSGLTVVVGVVVIAACVYLGAELVLAAAGAPPLLASPTVLGEDLAGLADTSPPAAVLAAGVVAVVAGVALVVAALSPGRRARRALAGRRAVVVADDVVVASALARVAARAAAVHPDRVTVGVSRRTATARITPVSGTAVDVDAVRAAMQSELDRDLLEPPLRADVRVETAGRVGG